MSPPSRPASSGLHFDPIRGTTTSSSVAASKPTQSDHSSTASTPALGTFPSSHSPTISMAAIPSLLSPMQSPPIHRPATVPPAVSLNSTINSPACSSTSNSRTGSSRPSGSGFSIANLIDPPDTVSQISRHSTTHSRSSSMLDSQARHPANYSPSTVPSTLSNAAPPIHPPSHQGYPGSQSHTQSQPQSQSRSSYPSTLNPEPESIQSQLVVPVEPMPVTRNVTVTAPSVEISALPIEEVKILKKRKGTATKEKQPAAKKRQSEADLTTQTTPTVVGTSEPPLPPTKVTKPRRRTSQKPSLRKSIPGRETHEESIIETDTDVTMVDVTLNPDDNPPSSNISEEASTPTALIPTKRVAKVTKRAPRAKKTSSLLVTDVPGIESPSELAINAPPEIEHQTSMVQDPPPSGHLIGPIDIADTGSVTSTATQPKAKPEKKRRKPKVSLPEDPIPSDNMVDVGSPPQLIIEAEDIEIPVAALLGAFVPPPLAPTNHSVVPISTTLLPQPTIAINNGQVNAVTATKPSSAVSKAPSQSSTLTPPPGPAKVSSKKGSDFVPALALLPGMAMPLTDPKDQTGTDIWLTFPLKGQNNVTLNFAREVERKYGFGALNPRIAAHNSRRKAIWKMGEELERQEKARKSGNVEDDSGDDIHSVDLNSDDGRGSDGDAMDVDGDQRRRAGSPTHSSEERTKLEQMNLDPEKWKFAKNGRLVRRRKKRQEEYDRNDEFIDDTEMAWDEQARMAQDGFFVYSGPLALDGAAPTANGKSDGVKPSRAVRAKTKGKPAAGVATATEDGTVSTGSAAPKAPRARKSGANQAAGSTAGTTTRKRATKAEKAAAAAAAAAKTVDGSIEPTPSLANGGVPPAPVAA